MYLVVGDLHLTDRPQDAYRFGIFEWIRKQQLAYRPAATFILGDIADQKDRHSATLVNKLIEGLELLQAPVIILKGNHDYIDPDNPFFGFLNSVKGLRFVVTPGVHKNIMLIPHIRDEREFANAFRGFARPDYLLLHQTIEGAIAETGAPLTGFSAAPIKALAPRLGTYAGDVHKPQRAGPVTYVGAPYNVRFGDDFDPRVLLLDREGGEKNLYFDCPRKWKLTIRSTGELVRNKNLLSGDQVKITLELAREEAVEWKTHKQQILNTCKGLSLEVFGVDLLVKTNTKTERVQLDKNSKTNSDILINYCKKENVSAQIKAAGLGLLKGP